MIPASTLADTNDVNWASTTLIPDAVRAPGPPQPWTSRLVHWVVAARSHRVVCLVFGIWLLNGFDLAFTILSYRHGLLQEKNPVARLMLQDGVASIVLFKIGLVLIGSYPLLRFRRVRLTELAAYLVFAAYALLAIRWSTCFELYAATLPTHYDLSGFDDAVSSLAPP